MLNNVTLTNLAKTAAEETKQTSQNTEASEEKSIFSSAADIVGTGLCGAGFMLGRALVEYFNKDSEETLQEYTDAIENQNEEASEKKSILNTVIKNIVGSSLCGAGFMLGRAIVEHFKKD